jgi:hypothetical protein
LKKIRNIMDNQENDFVSAGFFVSKRVPRQAYMSSALLPEKLISASHCIGNFIPDLWAIEWVNESQESRAENAEAFGIDSTKLKEVINWVTPRFGDEIGWPNICFNLAIAKEIKTLFVPEMVDSVIIELALHRKFIDAFCAEAEPAKSQADYAPVGKQGVYEAILKGRTIMPGGMQLGFEPLVFDGALSCSWLCNGLEKDIKERFGISPNKYGFIELFEDACKSIEYISREDVGAEPGLWLPWLLIEINTTSVF